MTNIGVLEHQATNRKPGIYSSFVMTEQKLWLHESSTLNSNNLY